jgi:hypothetical protein
VLAVIAIVVSGCGGAEELNKADYTKRMDKAAAAHDSRTEGADDDGENEIETEAAFKESMSTLADDLEGFEPDSDAVARVHGELIAAIRAGEDTSPTTDRLEKNGWASNGFEIDD